MSRLPSINEQLNIPLIEGGAELMQPELFDGSLAEYRANDYNYRIVRGSAYWNADGYFDCKSKFPTDPERCAVCCATHHPFNKTKRQNCQKNCANIVADIFPNLTTPFKDVPPPSGSSETPSPDTEVPDTTRKGLSNGAKIGIAVGIIALIGAGTYLYIKKKK